MVLGLIAARQPKDWGRGTSAGSIKHGSSQLSKHTGLNVSLQGLDFSFDPLQFNRRFVLDRSARA